MSAAFSDAESAAILKTSKSDLGSNDGPAATNILVEDQVFFLSGVEVSNSSYGFVNNSARQAGEVYWLRSPAQYYRAAQIVQVGGGLNSLTTYDNSFATRPACNLMTEGVLFSTAADASAEKEFGRTADYGGNEWKVTLKDENSFDTGALKAGSTSLKEGYAAETLIISHAALGNFQGGGTTR